MAEVRVNIQNITARSGGLEPSRSTGLNSSDTHLIRNDGQVFIWAKNTDASDHDVTVVTPGTVSGLEISDLTATIPSESEKFLGPFSRNDFNNPNNDMEVTLSDGTGMELGAFRL